MHEQSEHATHVRVVEDPRNHHALVGAEARDVHVRVDDGETREELADLHERDQRLGGIRHACGRDRVVSVHDRVDEGVQEDKDPQALVGKLDAQVDVPRRSEVVKRLQEGYLLALEHQPRRVQVFDVLGIVEGPCCVGEEFAVVHRRRAAVRVQL